MASFRVNQVVFARGENDLWYPAVVIDPEDREIFKKQLQPNKPGFIHILWLGGSGRITPIDDGASEWPPAKLGDQSLSLAEEETKPRNDLDDFHKCMSSTRVNTESKYILAISLAVKLAAVRSGSENPDQAWLRWGNKNLHKLQPLLVTKAFYKSFVPSPSPTAAKHSQMTSQVDKMGGSGHPMSPFSEEQKAAQLLPAQFIWVKVGMSDAFWPAVVMEKAHWPPEKLSVVVLEKNARKFDVKIDMVLDFCGKFVEKLNEEKFNEERDYRWSVKVAVLDIQKTLTGLKDENHWLDWAKRILPTQKQIVASARVQNFVFGKHGLGRSDSPPDDPKQATPEQDQGAPSGSGAELQLPFKKRMTAKKSFPKKRKIHQEPPKLPTDINAAAEKEPKTIKDEPTEEKTGSVEEETEKSQMILDAEKEKRRKERKRKKLEKKMKEKMQEDKKRKEGKKETQKTPEKKRRISTQKKGELSPEELENLKIPLDMGWTRLLVYRKNVNTPSGKKCDVYYKPPDGSKQLRSNPDIQKYLESKGITDLKAGIHFSFKDITVQHKNQETK